MKCPECGFNSFDGLDRCKKCGADLEMSGQGPEPEASAQTDLDLSFRPESALRGEAPQGELFSAGGEESPAADDDEGLVGEAFAAGADMATGRDDPAASSGEPEARGVADVDAREAADADRLWKPRLLAGIADLLFLAALVGLFVACARLVLAGFAPLTAYLPVAAAAGFIYFTFFHYLAGQSPGKMIFGLVVECREGGALTFSRAFLRSFGGTLCVLSLGFGFAAALWRADGCGWNDRLAGSRVVRLTSEKA
ncbi:MAG: RDD family protein [Desulfuromonadales bacterium]|nr:RDD family protein [Desulfuromonadales bacterium]NIS43417.1 RDD family protein [Desulfuromonadales bacterium]